MGRLSRRCGVPSHGAQRPWSICGANVSELRSTGHPQAVLERDAACLTAVVNLSNRATRLACGPGGRGFKPRHSPHSNPQVSRLRVSSFTAVGVQTAQAQRD